ncbi:MAG: hypothetical protein IMX00_09545 [Limnochordales bacterium]|nr:hypothetical protein [Limnochordales bacterium]
MSLVDAAWFVGAFPLVYVARMIVVHKKAVRETPLPPEDYLSWVRVPLQVGAADSPLAVLAKARVGVEQAAAVGEDGEKPPGRDNDSQDSRD